MKKYLSLLILLVGLSAGFQKVHAQTPYVDLIYFGDSSWTSNCTLPITINFMYYGYAPGYAANDSLHIEFNWGDGTTFSYYLPLIQGTTFYDDVDHTFTMPGAYDVQVIATGPDGSADTLVDQSVLVSTSCSDIAGQVYLDGNVDCIYNAGDTPIQTWVVARYNGNLVAGAQSNGLGQYFISVPSGFTYTVETFNSQFLITCPASGNYVVSSLPSAGNDFALECNPAFDYACNIGGQGFRVNGLSLLWLNAFNEMISCAPPTGTLTLTLDPMLSYSSSSVTPVSVTSTQVVFNAGQLTGYNGFSPNIYLLTNPAAVIGDTLCVTLTIDPQAGDGDVTNNVNTLCLPVRNSCDPNEKAEAHAGVGSATILPGTQLDYTIMFQNVGNDVAFDVSIIDELDPNLDLTTLKITGFSHPASIYLLDNTLKFEFNNINLAAASVNEPLSHGYVTYTVDHIAGIPNGTSINNSANIYFDFNAPIITNTVTNIIDQSLAIQEYTSGNVSVYPNPASEYFMVSGFEGTAKLLVHDITGRQLLTSFVKEHQLINTKTFGAGVYMVTVELDNEKRISRLVVK